MRLALIGLAAFLLSLSASAMAVVLTRPGPETTAQASAGAPLNQSEGHNEAQPAVDTARVVQGEVDAAPQVRDSGVSTTAIAETQPEPVSAGDVVTRGTSGPIITASVSTLPQPMAETGIAAKDSAAGAREEAARQLARMFTAMRAQDAAAVLQHMTNAEVIGVLRFLSARQAGAVLSALDRERAAELSRELLNGRTGN